MNYSLGALFGSGLSLAHMPNNEKVIKFLRILDWSEWNPGLMFVLAAAVITFGIVYWYKDDKIDSGEVDNKLVAGSLAFGIGWGLTGICPGPGLTMISVPIILTSYIPSLFIGMTIANKVKTLNSNT